MKYKLPSRGASPATAGAGSPASPMGSIRRVRGLPNVGQQFVDAALGPAAGKHDEDVVEVGLDVEAETGGGLDDGGARSVRQFGRLRLRLDALGLISGRAEFSLLTRHAEDALPIGGRMQVG